MPAILAELSPDIPIETILAATSATMTAYFWLVKARKERPSLKIFQLAGFRASLRRGDPDTETKRLCLTQVDQGGVLIANNSTRQNSVVRFDCWLKHNGHQLKGRWGYVEEDRPPWNVGPESTIAMSLACFFDVPEDYEILDDFDFRVAFVTTSGQRFPHMFSRQAPEL